MGPKKWMGDKMTTFDHISLVRTENCMVIHSNNSTMEIPGGYFKKPGFSHSIEYIRTKLINPSDSSLLCFDSLAIFVVGPTCSYGEDTKSPV